MRISTTKKSLPTPASAEEEKKKMFLYSTCCCNTHTYCKTLNTSIPLLTHGSEHRRPPHTLQQWPETAETHRSLSKDYWHETCKQHINFIIKFCNMCIDNHTSSDRWSLLTTCINLVYFNIISQGFLFITHSFYRGGRETKVTFAERTSAMWPLKSERGLKEGSLIQSHFLLLKLTLNMTDKSSSSCKTLLNITCYLVKLINRSKRGLRNPFS